MRSRPLLPLLVVAAMSTACATGEVKTRFVRDASCPADRVTVHESGVVEPQRPEPPPAEIAADPERAAIYYESHRGRDVGKRVFVAEGCGVRRSYVCDHRDAHGHRWCEPAAD